jgi:hypothetical protein
MEQVEATREEPLLDLDRTIELVRHIREDYSEEIPAQIVRGTPGGILLKIQGGWFQSVVDVLQIVQQHIEFRGSIVPTEITDLLNYLTSQEFKGKERNNPEDISRANIVLELCRQILSGFKKE